MSVGVEVGVEVDVGVRVGVSVAVFVAVAVYVGVFVGILPFTLSTNCGRLAAVPLRLVNIVAVLLVVDIAKLYEPVPVTKDVTSTCVQVLAAI